MESIIWDMDDVIIPGRGTTWMAKLRTGDPSHYLEKLMYEDPLTRGRFSEEHVRVWVMDYNGGRPIETFYDAGRFITDLRRVYKVFQKEHTIYAKNKILEGITIGQVLTMPLSIPYMEGVQEAVDGLRARGAYQTIFSSSNAALVEAERRALLINYGEGVETEVRLNDGSLRSFDPSTPSNAMLTGNVNQVPSKLERILDFISRYGRDPKTMVVVDDSDIDMLKATQDLGALAIALPNGNDVTPFKEAGIPILKGTREPLVEIVFDHRAIGRYCV